MPVQQRDLLPAEVKAARAAHAMESVLLKMREHWFAATIRPFHGGHLVTEPDGELVTMVNAEEAEVGGLLRAARARRAYVVATPYGRPRDLSIRLRRNAFHLISRQGCYVYEGELLRESDLGAHPPAGSRGLLGWWRTPEPLAVAVEPVGKESLEEWNRVCWRAFTPRGVSEAQSMLEKQRAFRAMAERATWYLARHAGRGVGTCILYQEDGVAQILAVGTLPRYRGRGVATHMVRRAVYDWQQQSRGLLFLDTVPGGAPERLYLSLGFRRAYIREVFAP